MSCHSVINPLGFALEQFDAVGRFRVMEDEKPIDASAKYTTVDGKVLNIRSPRDVAEYAAAKESKLALRPAALEPAEAAEVMGIPRPLFSVVLNRAANALLALAPEDENVQ